MQIYGAAELFALSYEQTWNGLAKACDADYFLKGGLEGDSAVLLYRTMRLCVNLNFCCSMCRLQCSGTADPDHLCAATPFPSQKLYSIVDKKDPHQVELVIVAVLSQRPVLR